MVPFTLVIIFVLLYLTFRSFGSAALIMGTLPFALVGGLWLLFLLGYNLSIASAIGFIALAGVAAEFGVIMLIYLDHAIEKRRQANQFHTLSDLIAAIEEGAVLRVRPKAMTVAVIIAGLLPIMFGGGDGLGGHATHRGSHGRRHDHGADAVDAGAAGGLPADSSAWTRQGGIGIQSGSGIRSRSC